MRILALLLGLTQAQNCPDGWDYHENNCYYFSGIPDNGAGVTFGVAESECQHMGGHLLATLGFSEHQWLIQNDDLREMFSKVFIGAHKVNGKFTWTSGDEWQDKWAGNIPSQKRDLPWKEDEPMNDPNKLCVTMDMRKIRPGEVGGWEMESCSRPHTFVCKMPQNQVVVNCNDGFEEAANMCWLRIHEKMNFLDAQKACEEKGSYLAEIRNQQESYAFIEYMKASSAEAGPFWIGLRHDEGSQNPEKFTWQNSQEPIRFNEWLEGYPILQSPAENTCAFTEWDTDVEGRWMTTACDSEEYNFVCQHDLGLVCPKNWIRNDDMCYKNFATPAYRRSWTDAVNFCDDIGAEMVMIKDQKTQNFLALHHTSLLQIGVQDYWIGLSTTEDGFSSPRWIDGSPISYSEMGVLNGTYNPYCVEALTTASEGNWQDAYCGNIRSFICQARVGTRIYEPSEGMLDYLCASDDDDGEDWHFLNNTDSGELSCYMITETPTSWQRGSKICQDAGGYLTSITSQREQDFVEHLLYKKSLQFLSGDAWIGLQTTKGPPRNRKKYDGIPNEYWEDGKKYEFNNWAENQPMYTDKSDSWEGDCVCLYGLDHPTVGAWANKDCTRAFDKRPVCKRPMIKNPDTTPPGIIDEDQKEANIKYCGAPQWRWNAEFKSCYNVIDTPLPWDSQRKTCADNGGFMLDITSPNENQYVQTLVALLPSGAFWTGGFDAGRDWLPDDEDGPAIGQRNGNWKWDRATSPLPYFNWETDQPNLPQMIGPTCIEISANGKWANPECNEKRFTICERNPIYQDPVDPEEECDGPECCSGHIGLENGGPIPASAFYSNSENRTSSAADHGRLNRVYDVWGFGGYGGWMAEKYAKDPYLQVTFDDFYEVRGIITQGVDGGGAYGVQTFKEWTRSFAIRYAIGDGDYTDLVDDVGQTALFDGNYDSSSQVINMFPQALITKSIRVYPRQIKNNYAGLRMELIGCKATCVDSLGAARNPPSGMKIPDQAFTSSSAAPGHEAKHGRVVYSETRSERRPHQISVSNTVQTQELAELACQTEFEGNGALVSIHNSEDQELVQSKIQNSNPSDDDTCFWIGLNRKSSSWHWIDGSALSYNNWAAGEPKTGNCACMDSSKSFKWYARSCSSMSPYVCEGFQPEDVWIAEIQDNTQWLQIDLGEIHAINGVVVQGNPVADEYVKQFQLKFSDDGENWWWYYMYHPGGQGNAWVQKFQGNFDGQSTVSAYLRHHITARFVRVNPTLWEKRIALRVDIIGCKEHGRIECTDSAASIFDLSNKDHISADCPRNCAADDFNSDAPVFGTGQYEMTSSFCRAAIHDGRIDNINGGYVSAKKIKNNPESYKGSGAHGIQSLDLDSNTPGFIFEGDVLGCEDGWTGFREVCYYSPSVANGDDENLVTWSEAQQKCKEVGGYLATIDDQAEQDHVAAIMHQKQGINECWIGLTDKGHPNWYDKWAETGEQVRYTNWGMGEPNSGNSDSCVRMFRGGPQKGKWDDYGCDNLASFICEKPKVPVNSLEPDHEKCKVGWEPFGNRCYKFVQSPEEWSWAKHNCRGLGGELAAIHDASVNSFIASRIAENTLDHHNYWIGLFSESKLGTGEYFKWISKEPVDFTNWDTNEPGTANECAPVWTYRGEEQTGCIDKGLPGQLVGEWCSPNEEFTGAFIACEEGTGLKKETECTAMNKENGKWGYPNEGEGARQCWEKYNYVCDMMMEGESRPTIPSEPIDDTPCKTSEGWYGYDGGSKCYKFDNEPASWDNAKKHCNAYGASAHLVALHSYSQEQRLLPILSEHGNGVDHFWIGLSTNGVSGYRWVDFSPVDYVNWATNEPNNHNGEENCVEMINYGLFSAWNDYFCYSTKAYICEIDRSETPQTPTVPPTTPPQVDQRCNQEDFPDVKFYSTRVDVNGLDKTKCVAFIPELDSWTTADRYCHQFNGGSGRLIAIHSQKEVEFAISVLAAQEDQSTGKTWIGLQQPFPGEQYSWTDGTLQDFSFWAGSQPNNDNGKKTCAEMDVNTGLWVAAVCSKKQQGLCQFILNEGGAPPPPPPDFDQTGGCPEGWYRYRKRCFQFNGLDTLSPERLGFEAAEAKCVEQGGHLASIYDNYYNSFLSSILFRGPSKNLLIGLKYNGLAFPSWTDDQGLTFTNWGPNEPSNAANKCVELLYHGTGIYTPGHWQTVDCDQKRPFVCQLKLDSQYPDDPNQAPNPNNCPTGYYPYDTSCYKLNSAAASRSQARANCESESHSNRGFAGLVTVWNEHESQFISSMLWGQNNNLWLGMNFAYDADIGRANYYWDDNFPIVFTNWGHDEPKSSTDAQGYVELFKDGTWGISNSTSASLPYICKIETVPTPNPDTDLGESSCEPGWHLLFTDKGEEDLDGKYCYRERLEPKEFGDAYADCNIFGATIMSIHSEFEDKFAQSIIGHDNAWLGAINMPDGNGEVYPTGWQWLDETAFKYTNWAEGEPSLNGDEYCLELWTNGFWNDVACTGRKPYVCQKRSIHSFCAVPGPDRQLCGPINIDEMECADGFGCCWDPEIDQCFRPESTFQCLEMGGTCKPKDYIDCNRGIGPGADVCPQDKRCCLDCQTDQCEKEEEQWQADDGECLLAQGQCIFDSLSCSQVIGDGGVFGNEECGGPDDRRCCKKPTGPSTVTVTVTVPGSTATTDPSGGGLSGGAIFGIVFGVICSIIIAGTIAYFSGKNKSSAPLVPQASVSNPITYGKDEEEEDATYMGQMNPAFQENAEDTKE